MLDTDFEWVESFTYRRRLCVIVRVVNVDAHIAPDGVCHNGYVSVIPRNRNKKHFNRFDDRIKTVELTYSGNLRFFHMSCIPKSQWFFGFDTLHFWNSEQPTSQPYRSVKRQTLKLADEMIRKRI
jgi:hypothetical protein